jgi:hypothetical protein
MLKLGGKLLAGCGFEVSYGTAFEKAFSKALRKSDRTARGFHLTED